MGEGWRGQWDHGRPPYFSHDVRPLALREVPHEVLAVDSLGGRRSSNVGGGFGSSVRTGGGSSRAPHVALAIGGRKKATPALAIGRGRVALGAIGRGRTTIRMSPKNVLKRVSRRWRRGETLLLLCQTAHSHWSSDSRLAQLSIFGFPPFLA